MKKVFLAMVFVVLMAGIAFAVLPKFETITVADTAIGFTSSIIANNPITMVNCSLETGQIRFNIAGDDPTATTLGHLLEIGQWLCLGKCTGAGGHTALQQITNFRGIRTGTTSGVLNCSYE